MKWKITYYNGAVEDAILDLPDKLLARYVRLTEIMEEYGPNLGMPHTRSMGARLFELRLKGKEGIARVFYCTVVKQEILMLHTFIKKQQDTPLHELRIGKERLKEVLKNAKENT
jgi:phage-related protein